MKILMVSMPSLHFFRWTEQLQDAGHEIYWFNVTDSGEPVQRLDWVKQYYGWRLKWDFPGRTWLKTHWSQLSKHLEKLNTNSTETAFEKVLQHVQPDVVHSFALHISCTPILSVMNKYPNLKWIFSSWGSDLYARTKEQNTTQLPPVLNRVNYLFTDCNRDYLIAKKYGFTGEFLGKFPGGGGYSINFSKEGFKSKKNQIIIKGYENKHGKCIFILDQLKQVKKIKSHHILIFGANQKVIEYVHQNFDSSFKITIHKHLEHHKLIEEFKKSKIYMGFSLSDGTPNTMLEAMLSGCIVMQSNPGNATEEWITDGVNGFILYDKNVKSQIKKALDFKITNLFVEKLNYYTKELDRSKMAKLVIKKYQSL